MNRLPTDQADRVRFATEWGVNFAVVANAGSGKTTAISNRLAEMALSPRGGDMLARTAVVTYTKKAAAQIGQRARSALLNRMSGPEKGDVEALARLDRVFFGTIHSFCLLLARRHGSAVGIHLNPTLVEEDDQAYWQEFLEQDPMTFGSLDPVQVGAFIRHAPLDSIFELARDLDSGSCRAVEAARPPGLPPGPDPAYLALIRDAAPKRKGKGLEALERNKLAAELWARRFREETGPLPLISPEGAAAGIEDLYRGLLAPVKRWLAAAGGVLASELSSRYRAWRLDRGLQTYADQVETALSVLEDPRMLERIRAEGWRVILDEAQDTDPKQFAVLVEITRPPGEGRGEWPAGGGRGPQPGHFCMVGDAQQGIYSTRADIRNFQRHVDAFAGGLGGEKLTFGVTFRSPGRVVGLLNATLPRAFGGEREHNLGLPPEDGAPSVLLQVPYEPLVPGPGNPEGRAFVLPVPACASPRGGGYVDRKLAHEARCVAAALARVGHRALGVQSWGEVCILAPRKAWLGLIRDELEAAGLKTALQMRRNRNGDNPAYAWISGLLAVACDPSNTFEWVGVMREIFAVDDATIAAALGRDREFRWQEPSAYPVAVAGALEVLLPFIDRADLEGESLERYVTELAEACGLRAKARAVDPDGGLEDEVLRIQARAAELGLQGGGPRALLRELLAGVDAFRAYGRPSPDAITLMTSHSAKGLEWPVVIPVGLWRRIGARPQSGLRLLRDRDGGSHVVFDSEGVSAANAESLERERLRELVRLLYVTLTRPLRALVLPWLGESPDPGSFADLWQPDLSGLESVPEEASPREETPDTTPLPAGEGEPTPTGRPAPAFPRRVLPHQLAVVPDGPRGALHEASLDQPPPIGPAVDPLEYGVWWHEMLEFVPWTGDDAAVAAHGDLAVRAAEQRGFGGRAGEEWRRLLGSEPWRLMRESRWTRLAEVGVFAPLGSDGWIDGVIDLVLHDPSSGELWIVDWKTNRQAPGEAPKETLARLAAEYERQLAAYGSSAAGFFPGSRVRLWVYSTAVGEWTELSPRP